MNLFVTGDTMLKFMNENWKILSQEFGTTMLEKPNIKIYNALRTYMLSQPLENIIEY